MLVEQIPFNSLSWGVGSVALLLLSGRLLRSYRQSDNYLNKYFGLFGLVMGVSLGFTAFPAYFSTDVAVLRPYFLVGDLLLYVAILLQSRIMWFIGLKPYMSYGWVIIPATVASAVAWVYELRHASIGISGNFVHYDYPLLSAWIIAALLTLVILPAGFFFLREGLRAGPGQHIRSSLKAISVGLAYLVIGGTSVYSYAAFRGSDTMAASTANLLLYVGIIMLVLLPMPARKRAGPARPQRGHYKDRIIND